MDFMSHELGHIFISFLVIMNPFTSVAYFLGISKKFTDKEKADAINHATEIAGITMLVFLVIGPVLLSILGVSISSFQVAGGIVLLVISINFILGNLYDKKREVDVDASIMIIGVPLITGPGVLTTTMIMVAEYGYIPSLIAAIFAIVVVWLILKMSEPLRILLGEKGMAISSRIMGLLLAAIAVEFIKKGILTIAASAL
ncbi:MAG: MarC family protein [Candidatus Altiarchaeota archaeon]